MEFDSLTPEDQSVALLLYRKVAVELGEIDPEEEAVDAIWVDRNSDAREGEAYGFASDLAVIEETDEAQLYIPDHRVDAAVDHFDSDR